MSSNTLVGRDAELAELGGLMADAAAGKGSAVLISGEAGIGKTMLVDRFVSQTRTEGAKVLRGQASPDSGQPFLVVSSALDMGEPILSENEFTTFTALFAVNKAGLLIAQSAAETEGAMDADIFAGMLSAVQNFVRDSFDSSGAQHGSLGRLEYGNMKIIIKHGEDLFLAAVLSGEEHEDMDPALKRAIDSMEAEHDQVLKRWTGRLKDAEGIQAAVDALAARKFPVRRNLAGLKLESERLRIAHMMFERLDNLAGDAPVLLLLEDLHWADESSLAVLAYLARNITEKRVLILGTLRPGESKALDASMEKMHAESLVRGISLARLDEGNLRSLVDSMLSPNELPAIFIDRLAAQCAGNPFFATEILKQMAADGSIGVEEGRYVLVNPDYAIPDTVEEAVQRRLDTLESDAMAMVEYLSCIGMYFDREAALAMPSLKSPGEALGKLVSASVIVNREDGAYFCHGIFRDVTYNSIGERWRLAYHKSIGEHLEAGWDGTGELLYDLALHFLRSAEKQKAYGYCMKAADMAEASFAPEQAISFLRDAASVLPAQKLGPAEEEARLKIVERMADLAELMGDYAAVESLLGEMRASPGANCLAKARALRKLVHILEYWGKYDEGLDAAAEAKVLLGDQRGHEMAMVLMNEGAIYEQKRELDRSIATQREALAILMEVAPDDRNVARAHARIGTGLWLKSDYDAALESFLRGLEISERHCDLRGIATAMNNIGIVYLRKGDYNKAAEYLHKARDTYSKIGDQSGMASASGNLGNVHIAKGDLEGAMEAYDICLTVFTRLGAKMPLGMTLMNIGSIMEHKGDFARAMDFYERSREVRLSIGDRRGLGVTTLNMGNLHYDMGDFRRSLELHEQALAIMEETGDRNGITHALCGIVRARIKLGRTEGCALLVERAIGISRELGMAENEMTALVLAGRLASLSGDWVAAEEAFDTCIRYGRDGGYKRLLADGLWGKGMMLAAKGDREGALSTLAESRELYVEMSQPHLIREIEEDIAKLGP